jgi:cytochrome b561
MRIMRRRVAQNRIGRSDVNKIEAAAINKAAQPLAKGPDMNARLMGARRSAETNLSKGSHKTYGSIARLFHWLTLLLVALLIPFGLVMTSLDPGKPQDLLFVIHQSLGLTLFALILMRLGWRLRHSPPPSRDLSSMEIKASQFVHWLLYLALLAMPITGYVMVVAGGDSLSYFGFAEVPRLLAKNRALSNLADTAHLSLQYAVYGLVAIHAAAALHHHFWRRNDVLTRMLPSLRRRA